MTDLQLLLDLHLPGHRQGPGGEAQTRLAARLAGLDTRKHLNIADIGCGTGAATFELARLLDAHITAVDLFPEFLGELEARARAFGLEDKITTLACDMAELPFGEGELDVIWSEGAIYNIGFGEGIAKWRRFLKPGGVLVVSEITWLTGSRPAEVEEFWTGNYAEMGTASEKIALLERNGYSPEGYFVLPPSCWKENYYEPLQRRFGEFLARHRDVAGAPGLVAGEEAEIAIYDQYASYFGYGVYVARVTGE